MSTQGHVRRRWIDIEVYSDTLYYDGDETQTIREFGMQAGRFELKFSRWWGTGFTHIRDWRWFAGTGLKIARTPWGTIEAYADDASLSTIVEGDVPREVEEAYYR